MYSLVRSHFLEAAIRWTESQILGGVENVGHDDDDLVLSHARSWLTQTAFITQDSDPRPQTLDTDPKP